MLSCRVEAQLLIELVASSLKIVNLCFATIVEANYILQ